MWKWLNPWRELRQAREQIALLEAECDALDREARDARRVAYAEAHEHYEMRTKALQASHDQLLQRCVDIQNMMRSEEHTSELQSLMRISYAVFCLTNKKTKPKVKKYIIQQSYTPHTTILNRK